MSFVVYAFGFLPAPNPFIPESEFYDFEHFPFDAPINRFPFPNIHIYIYILYTLDLHAAVETSAFEFGARVRRSTYVGNSISILPDFPIVLGKNTHNTCPIPVHMYDTRLLGVIQYIYIYTHVVCTLTKMKSTRGQQHNYNTYGNRFDRMCPTHTHTHIRTRIYGYVRTDKKKKKPASSTIYII